MEEEEVKREIVFFFFFPIQSVLFRRENAVVSSCWSFPVLSQEQQQQRGFRYRVSCARGFEF